MEILEFIFIASIIIWFPVSIIWTLVSATAAGLSYLGVLVVAFALSCKDKNVYKAFIPTLIITPYIFFSVQLNNLDENGGNFMVSIFAMFIILAISVIIYFVIGRRKRYAKKVDPVEPELTEESVNYGVGDFDGHGWSIEK